MTDKLLQTRSLGQRQSKPCGRKQGQTTWLAMDSEPMTRARPTSAILASPLLPSRMLGLLRSMWMMRRPCRKCMPRAMSRAMLLPLQ